MTSVPSVPQLDVLAQNQGPRKQRNGPTAPAPAPVLHPRGDSPLGLSRCPSSDGVRTSPPPTSTPTSGPVATWTPGSGHRFRSMRCLRDDNLSPTSWASMQLPGHLLSDAASVRSLASIGMGSTDGRKLTIRRVPTSPNELLNYSMNGTRM
ncbi:hypothetical protein ONE63_002546 [Megalurothrips usitatus]|uniref:Uncharacterized protein n=1 Tax=Megalurothrips usitatus TaxID=439358 RepID=A0AAV7XEL9_9NEOP|nr:hypothetical protein ONE63_002546 [Megalurothrips usitatus]